MTLGAPPWMPVMGGSSGLSRLRSGDVVLLAVGLALLAAFLFAGSDSLQQHAAHDTDYAPEVGPGSRRRGRPAIVPALITLVRGLVHRPLWVAGWLINLVSFLVQATALHFGSVALVQPILVTQLLFTLPIASAWCRRWPQARDWLSGLAISAGLAHSPIVRTGRARDATS